MSNKKKSATKEVENVEAEEEFKELLDSVTNLAEDAVQGRLDARIDTEKFEGDYREIAKAMNDTLDAIIEPLNVAGEYIDRISKGDIPEKITDDYNGVLTTIKDITELEKAMDGDL